MEPMKPQSMGLSNATFAASQPSLKTSDSMEAAYGSRVPLDVRIPSFRAVDGHHQYQIVLARQVPPKVQSIIVSVTGPSPSKAGHERK